MDKHSALISALMELRSDLNDTATGYEDRKDDYGIGKHDAIRAIVSKLETIITDYR